MTEWWVSSKKNFCKICRVWTGGHIRQIQKHEQGRAHQENEARNIKDARERAKVKEAEEADVLKQLAEIERQAAASMVAQPGGGAPPAPRAGPTPEEARLQREAERRRIEEVAAAAKRRKLEPAGAAHGWTEHLDPGSKTPYYYNTITKESRWVRPAELDAAPPAAAPSAVAMPAPAAPPGAATSVSPAAGTAHGWTEHLDPGSKTPYYYNTITKESRWVRPAELDAAPPAIAVAEAVVAPAAAPSPVSTSADPAAPGVAAPAASATPAAGRAAGSAAVGPPAAVATPGAQAPAADPAASGGASWIVCTDPNSGTVYYYNQATMESSWEKPAELAIDLSKPPPPPSAKKPPPPPARKPTSSSTEGVVGAWEVVQPEDSMWKPDEPAAAEPDSDDEAPDPLLIMKGEAMRRGEWMDEDLERHDKPTFEKRSSEQQGAGGSVSFRVQGRKAAGIRKRTDPEDE